MYKIYKLVDLTNDHIRYIGVTKRDLSFRLWQHIHGAKKGATTHTARWLRKINFRVKIELVEELKSDDTWKDSEKRWIKHHRDLGHALTNSTDGGDGTLGLRWSAGSRQKMTLAAIKRFADPNERDKISLVLKSRYKLPLKSKMSYWRGRTQTKETCLRRAKSLRQYYETHDGPSLGKLRSTTAKTRTSESLRQYHNRRRWKTLCAKPDSFLYVVGL